MRIAIIGAGFSGTLLALHLLRRCPNWVNVVLVERNPQFGRGAAYSSGNPNHLLNVPAGRMSAFHDRPHDFLDWLKAQKDLDLAEPPTERSFVPRRQFGAYVRNLLNQEMKVPGQGSRLELVRGDVVAIESGPGGLVLKPTRREPIQADLVVLAVGNFPPEPPPVADPSFYDFAFYRPDPWAADAFSDLDPGQPVLLIGTGLTMVDAVVSLDGTGHRGAIHALSRRGLLPQRHLASAPPSPRQDPVPTSLVELARFLRAEARRARDEGSSWQPIVDELRPFTLDVWGSLSGADKARFLRHLRPWWETHRHRMAGAVAGRIDAACMRGQLQVHAGRIQNYTIADGRITVTYRVRSSSEIRSVDAVRVINCAGPGADYDRIADPLVRNLLDSGLVRADPLRLGLDVTSSCAIKDRRGAISGRLFAVGPVTKGAFWEMTAVPDIRRQCEYLANHLSTIVKPAAAQPKPAAVATG